MQAKRTLKRAALLVGVFAFGVALGWGMKGSNVVEGSGAADHAASPEQRMPAEHGEGDAAAVDKAYVRHVAVAEPLLRIIEEFDEHGPSEPQNTRLFSLAISMLGELRVEKAIPRLLELIYYEPPVTVPRRLQTRLVHPSTGKEIWVTTGCNTVYKELAKLYPPRPPLALVSLIKIGEPAVGPAVAFLRKPDLGRYGGCICSYIIDLLKAVKGDEGKDLLVSALQSEDDPRVRDRLKRCIDGYDNARVPEELTGRPRRADGR